MEKEIILVTGGVKSGKSSWALQCGEEKGSERAFIATATALDKEMERKILMHQKERGNRWTTFEEPKDVTGLFERIKGEFDVVLIDCLTLWVSNLLTIYNMTEDSIVQESGKFISALEKATPDIILVTNEVGMGIMPADHVSRSYQDLLGRLNRDAAGIADSVCLMVSGIAQKIK